MTDSRSLATIIDGRAVAARIAGDVADGVEGLKAATLTVPGLAVVLVGDNPASRLYVGGKSRKAGELGFHSVQHNLPAGTSEADLLALIDILNRDPLIHGILVQLPLPPQIDKDKVIEAILPEKDVDGFHPVNVGRLAAGLPGALREGLELKLERAVFFHALLAASQGDLEFARTSLEQARAQGLPEANLARLAQALPAKGRLLPGKLLPAAP